jgi:hypothetical protein
MHREGVTSLPIKRPPEGPVTPRLRHRELPPAIGFIADFSNDEEE